MMDSLSVLSCLSSSSSLLCNTGGAAQGLPTKAFQSHWGSISSPNLLCSSVHLQLSHWSLTPTYSHAQKHTLKVANVMCERLSSSFVFTGVLSPLPRLSLQSRWLSLVDSGKPLLSLMPHACVESRVATWSRIITFHLFIIMIWIIHLELVILYSLQPRWPQYSFNEYEVHYDLKTHIVLHE